MKEIWLNVIVSHVYVLHVQSRGQWWSYLNSRWYRRFFVTFSCSARKVLEKRNLTDEDRITQLERELEATIILGEETDRKFEEVDFHLLFALVTKMWNYYNSNKYIIFTRCLYSIPGTWYVTLKTCTELRWFTIAIEFSFVKLTMKCTQKSV